MPGLQAHCQAPAGRYGKLKVQKEILMWPWWLLLSWTRLHQHLLVGCLYCASILETAGDTEERERDSPFKNLFLADEDVDSQMNSGMNSY